MITRRTIFQRLALGATGLLILLPQKVRAAAPFQTIYKSALGLDQSGLTRTIPMRFECPLLCECVVDYAYTFSFSDKILNGPPLMRDDYIVNGRYDVVSPATAMTVLGQCTEHAHLTSPQALFDEIWHWHGNKVTNNGEGSTCTPKSECSVSYAWDDRQAQEDREHFAVEHWKHTHRCQAHAHLRTTDQHIRVFWSDPARSKMFPIADRWSED